MRLVYRNTNCYLFSSWQSWLEKIKTRFQKKKKKGKNYSSLFYEGNDTDLSKTTTSCVGAKLCALPVLIVICLGGPHQCWLSPLALETHGGFTLFACLFVRQDSNREGRVGSGIFLLTALLCFNNRRSVPVVSNIQCQHSYGLWICTNSPLRLFAAFVDAQ